MTTTHFPIVKDKKLLELMPRTSDDFNVDALVKFIEMVIHYLGPTCFEQLREYTGEQLRIPVDEFLIYSDNVFSLNELYHYFWQFLELSFAGEFFELVLYREAYQDSTQDESDSDQKENVDALNECIDPEIDHHEQTDLHASEPTRKLPDGFAFSGTGAILLRSHARKRSNPDQCTTVVPAKRLRSSAVGTPNDHQESTHSNDAPRLPVEDDQPSNSPNPIVLISDLMDLFHKHTNSSLLSHEDMVEQLKDTKAILKGLLSNTMRECCECIDASFESTKNMVKSPNPAISTTDLHIAALGRVYSELESRLTPSFISQHFSNLFTELQYSLADASGMDKLTNIPQPYRSIIEQALKRRQ